MIDLASTGLRKDSTDVYRRQTCLCGDTADLSDGQSCSPVSAVGRRQRFRTGWDLFAAARRQIKLHIVSSAFSLIGYFLKFLQEFFRIIPAVEPFCFVKFEIALES